jgi:hypothetical protein
MDWPPKILQYATETLNHRLMATTLTGSKQFFFSFSRKSFFIFLKILLQKRFCLGRGVHIFKGCLPCFDYCNPHKFKVAAQMTFRWRHLINKNTFFPPLQIKPFKSQVFYLIATSKFNLFQQYRIDCV